MFKTLLPDREALVHRKVPGRLRPALRTKRLTNSRMFPTHPRPCPSELSPVKCLSKKAWHCQKNLLFVSAKMWLKVPGIPFLREKTCNSKYCLCHLDVNLLSLRNVSSGSESLLNEIQTSKDLPTSWEDRSLTWWLPCSHLQNYLLS